MRRTVGRFRGTLSAAPVLALALQHDEIVDEEIAVDRLALAELEHDRTHPAANDPHYAYARPLAVTPPRPARVPAPILYEEFHPYGSSAYRAVGSGIEVSAKRYRYTGKERDEETGLDHMGARYYASWLGRWTAADPIGISGGLNLYEYTASNPVKLVDPSGYGPQLVTEQYTIPDEPRQVKVEGPVEAAYEFEDHPVTGQRPDPLAEAHGGRARSPQESFARARAEHTAGEIILGRARPPGLREDAKPIVEGGFVVGFTAGVAGSDKTGDELQQVFNIAGEAVGAPVIRGSAEQNFTIELTVADLLALKGIAGGIRAGIAVALERRAAQKAIQHESRRFAAERAAGFAQGSTPAAFADALIQAEARVAASRATTEGGARLTASAGGGGAGSGLAGQAVAQVQSELRETDRGTPEEAR